MRAGTGGSEAGDRNEREWILRCEGFKVYGPDGYIGVVVAVMYDHSARWDAPRGLRVRGATGAELIITADAIADVDAARGSLVISRRV